MAGMRPISPGEEAGILAAMRCGRDRLFYLFGRYTGFRVTEILSVRIADVWRQGTIASEITIARRNLKAGKGILRDRISSRTVPLHPRLRTALQRNIRERFRGGKAEPSEFLFKSRIGQNRPICREQAYRIIKSAANANGNSMRIGTHSLRKSFAKSIFEQSGHDLVLTQLAMGHASVHTTALYVAPHAGAVAAAILALHAP